MLSLTRRVGQKIEILLDNSKKIVLTVCRIKKHSVQIGFEGDKNIPILRSEILDPTESKKDYTL